MSTGVDGYSGHAVWDATLSALQVQHPAVQDAAVRAAVVHWFDDSMLAALAAGSRPAAVLGVDDIDGLPRDLLMAAMESLPFVEAYGGERYRLHAQVRQVVLGGLLTRDRGFVDAVSAAAVNELLRRNEAYEGLDADEFLELAYLLLIVDEEQGARLIDDIFAGEVEPTTAARLDRLMRYIDERREEGRLSDSLLARSTIWSVWTAKASGDYERAATIGEEALPHIGFDLDLSDSLVYEVASARWMLGDRQAAARLATGLVERRRGSRLGALTMMLLGDTATSPDETEIFYCDALRSLLTEARVPEWAGVSIHSLTWTVGELSPTGDDEPQAIVGIEYGGDSYWIPADGLYGELWLRLGKLETRRARVARATAWLERAKELFGSMRDTHSFQRTVSAQQLLAARHGDKAGLQKGLETQEAMLVWAQATGANQLQLQTMFDLGDAYLHLNDLGAARAHFQKAADVAASMGESGVAAIAAERLAWIAITQGRFDDADLNIQRAAAAYETDSADDARRLDLLVGDRWLAAQEPELARQAFTRAFEWASAHDRPDDEVAARLGLARAARNTFDLSGAEVQIAAATALAPRIDPLDELDVLLEHVTVLRLLRRDDEASAVEMRIEDRAGELSVRHMFAWLLVSRAETAARRGDHVDAISAYRDAIREFDELGEDSAIFQCVSGLAWEFSAAGYHEDALTAARQAKAIAAESKQPALETDAIHTMGTVLVEADRHDEAIAELLEAHRRGEVDSAVCLNLGWAYLRADKFEESLEWSRRALKLDPASAFPYRNIGHALLGLGRIDEANEAYEKAIEGRFGDDHFRNTLEELELLGRRHPGLAGLEGVLGRFRDEQAKIDAAGHEANSTP